MGVASLCWLCHQPTLDFLILQQHEGEVNLLEYLSLIIDHSLYSFRLTLIDPASVSRVPLAVYLHLLAAYTLVVDCVESVRIVRLNIVEFLKQNVLCNKVTLSVCLKETIHKLKPSVLHVLSSQLDIRLETA
jgi:hypothetical protein